VGTPTQSTAEVEVIAARLRRWKTTPNGRSAMLTLTETASNVVKAIIEQNPEVENAGLRINAQGTDENAELGVAVVEAPEATDQVLEHDGARVFLDEGATIALADKVLDAQVGSDGSVSFAIGQQAE